MINPTGPNVGSASPGAALSGDVYAQVKIRHSKSFSLFNFFYFLLQRIEILGEFNGLNFENEFSTAARALSAFCDTFAKRNSRVNIYLTLKFVSIALDGAS